MEELTLEARQRDPGKPRRVRSAGFVPAVVYGRGRPPQSIEVEEHALQVVLDRAGRHHIVHVGGQPTLVQEVQRQPTTGRVLHVDFHAVSLQEAVHAEVPLRVAGEEKLHKATGAIVQHQMAEVRVTCRPADLPDFVVVDVSGLGPGEQVTVAGLALPAGVEPLHDPGEVVLSVLAPRVETAETAPAAAEPDAAKRDTAEGAGD